MVGGDDAIVGKLLETVKRLQSLMLSRALVNKFVQKVQSVNEGADETISFRDLNFVNLIQEDLVLLIKFRHS